MNKRYALLALGLLTAFAFGRYTAPTKVEIKKEIVTVEVEKKNEKTDLDRERTTIEIKKPDGTVIKKTQTKTEKTTDTQTDKSTATTSTESKVVESKRDAVRLEVLGGINVRDPAAGLIYGGHISKPMLGPITLGAWFLTTGTGGLSLGLQF